MESREENKTYYWTVKGQRVEITEEVYRGILLENERVRRLARNEQRCSRTDSLYCLGDCSALKRGMSFLPLWHRMKKRAYCFCAGISMRCL